jgi:hypothetical protein
MMPLARVVAAFGLAIMQLGNSAVYVGRTAALCELRYPLSCCSCLATGVRY